MTPVMKRNSFAKATFDAFDRSMAIIEFTPDGKIINANENFLKTLGYTLQEIQGKHHSLFIDPNEQRSEAYRLFWDELRKGNFSSAEYKRIAKGGREVWIQATYNPVLHKNGKVEKIVKIATDITSRKLEAAYAEGQIAAISKSQAMISFQPDGTIVDANENFLSALGYTLEEVQGKHHSLFIAVDEKGSEAYQLFWSELRKGNFKSAEYRRLGKGGREVWIQATYNPIFDFSGNVYRVVKYAVDITEQVRLRQERQIIQRQIDNDLTEVAASASQSAANSLVIAASSEKSSASMQSVAAAVEELSASALEISHQISQSRESTEQAVIRAKSTDKVVSGLTTSAERITSVVKLISDIAAQTNLLALNATIEAARAGEAGRGFAVVANEVKQLALQSGKATEDISAQVEQIQTVSTQTAEAIEEIINSILQISEVATATAGAVEEQSSVTAEVTANVQEVASGVEATGRAIAEMANASELIEKATYSLKASSAKLA